MRPVLADHPLPVPDSCSGRVTSWIQLETRSEGADPNPSRYTSSLKGCATKLCKLHLNGPSFDKNLLIFTDDLHHFGAVIAHHVGLSPHLSNWTVRSGPKNCVCDPFGIFVQINDSAKSVIRLKVMLDNVAYSHSLSSLKANPQIAFTKSPTFTNRLQLTFMKPLWL